MLRPGFQTEMLFIGMCDLGIKTLQNATLSSIWHKINETYAINIFPSLLIFHLYLASVQGQGKLELSILFLNCPELNIVFILGGNNKARLKMMNHIFLNEHL